MAEPISAQMRTAVPAGDDNNGIHDPLASQHLQDDHTCAALAVIILDFRSVGQACGPSIVRSLGEFLGFLQTFQESLDIRFGRHPPRSHGVFGAAITDNTDVLHKFVGYLQRGLLKRMAFQFRGLGSTSRPIQQLDRMHDRHACA